MPLNYNCDTPLASERFHVGFLTMYQLNDTIVAVSSPTSDNRVIIRITGPDTADKVSQIFRPSVPENKAGLTVGSVLIDAELKIDAKLYLFLAPHSYTADDVAEIHIRTNPGVTEALISSLVARRSSPETRVTSHESRVRMAGPGEFTARAYLNGKIDLAQAEAVNEIITSSNEIQLAAAEKLLGGRLAESIAKLLSAIVDCLSLIEAGLDFSGEDIEFTTGPDAIERLAEIRGELEQLLAGSFSCESVIDLPAVGIAGAVNAGKSSLLNKLLGKARSIVSEQRKTTRDVLAAPLRLTHCQCVLFDCAGLTRGSSLVARRSGHGSRGTGHERRNILDELAQQAAIESLAKASVVVFCVDISKADWSEDTAIRKLIFSAESRFTSHESRFIAVATKSDLLCDDVSAERLAELNELFGTVFLATSAKTGAGIELLRKAIDSKIVDLTFGSGTQSTSYEPRATSHVVALTARHKQAVSEAIENIDESISELKAGNDEITAMMLRAAYQAVSNIEQHSIDEQVLENIFRRFCIGK